MRKLLCLLAVLSFFILGIPVQAEGEPDIGSTQAILVDSNSGQVLYEKGSADAIAGGASAKLMAVYAYQGKDTVSYKAPQDVNFPSSLPLEEGKEIPAEDLKQAVMIGGYDDCAYALSLGDKNIVKHMDQLAKDMQLSGTKFTDSYDSGKKEQTSTVKDLAGIGRLFTSEKELRPYYSTVQYTPQDKEPITRTLPAYDGLVGGMASETTAVFSAERGNTKLTVAVSGAVDENVMQEDIKKLLDYGYANFKSALISKDTIGVKEVELKVGDVKKHYKFYMPSDLYALMNAEADESKLTTDITMLDEKDPERIEAYLVISMDGNELGRIRMQKKVSEEHLKSPAEKAKEYFDYTCLGIAGTGVILFIFKYVSQMIKPQ